jgi:tetratricopeptide (TPR) repeat protein
LLTTNDLIADRYYKIGLENFEQGGLDNSINFLSQACMLSTRVEVYRYMLADIYTIKAKITGNSYWFDVAISEAKKQTKERPKRVVYRIHLGDIYMRAFAYTKNSKYLKLAEKAYRDFQNLDPKSALVKHRFGLIHEAKGEFGLAKEKYLQALKQIPTEATFKNALARVKSQKN